MMTTSDQIAAAPSETTVLGAAESQRPGASWRPVDLAVVLRDGFETPVPTVGSVAGAEHALFYPGRVNSIFGDSGGGKSWVAAACIVEALCAARAVVLVDLEDTAPATVQRLVQLGATKTQILEHLLYVSPVERWTPNAERHLLAAIAGRDVALAIIDSAGEAMALDGANPNSDDDVARWFRGAARVLARAGAAVVLIDHVVKSTESTRGRDFAIGSQRKRAAINGAAYLLDVVTPPSREADGRLKLIVRKDRHGHRRHGAVACEVTMANRSDGTIDMQLLVPAGLKADGSFYPTGLMERVSEYLAAQAEPVPVRRVREAVQGKSQFVAAAIDALVALGYVRRAAGPNRAQLLSSLRPFAAADLAGDGREPF